MPKINRDGAGIYDGVHDSGPPVLLTHGYSSMSAMLTAKTKGRITKHATVAAWLIVTVFGALAPAGAQVLAPARGPFAPSFTATLSNSTPLVFGMDAEDAARALGTPLNYVSGRPGDEIFLAFRNVGGNVLFLRKDRLYLQFRNGRLAGWKGDWGHNWMWQ